MPAKMTQNEAIDILELFLQATSQDPEFDEALSPHREHASELLDELLDHDTDLLDQAVGFYGNFIEAARCDPFAASSTPLLTAIGAYDAKIMQGFYLRKYSLPETDFPGIGETEASPAESFEAGLREEAGDQDANKEIRGRFQETLPADSGSLRTEASHPVKEAMELIGSDDVPDDLDFASLALELLDSTTPLLDAEDPCSNLAAAWTLLEASATLDGHDESHKLLALLAAALARKPKALELDVGKLGVISTNDAMDNEESLLYEALLFCAYCRELLCPSGEYGYDPRWMIQTQDSYDGLFPSLGAFSPLFSLLRSLAKISPQRGLDNSIINFLDNQHHAKNRIDTVRDEARRLHDDARLSKFPDQGFIREYYNRLSDIGNCLDIVAENRIADKQQVEKLVESYLLRNGNNGEIDSDEIIRQIERHWRNVKPSPLETWFSNRLKDAVGERIKIMQTWLALHDKGDTAIDSAELTSLRTGILGEIATISEKGLTQSLSQGQAVIERMLSDFEEHLAAQHTAVNGTSLPLFASFLKTPYFTLTDDLMPLVHARFNKVKYYEPWRNALRHIACSPVSFPEVQRAVFKDESKDFFDNLRQLEQINTLIGDEGGRYAVTPGHFDKALEVAFEYSRDFRSSLELGRVVKLTSATS